MCLGALCLFGCRTRLSVAEQTAVWEKVHLNLADIDQDGHSGPLGGKVAVNYEFCLPAQKKYWQKVKRIDKTAQKMTHSQGRVGCGSGQWLIVGSTEQRNFKRVLYRLAEQPVVLRIEQTYWEK